MDSGITAEIIAHSKATNGSEMVSIKTIAPKFLDAECITGDTELHFERSAKPGHKSLAKMTVQDFFSKWTNGISKTVPKVHKHTFDTISKLEGFKGTRKEASLALGKYPDFITSFLRNSNTAGFENVIDGDKLIACVKELSSQTVNVSVDYRPTLSSMSLRAIDIDNYKKITTGVIDIWESGVKQVFQVSTASSSIKVSGKHPFLTNRGWVLCEDLDPDADLLVMIVHKGHKVTPEGYLSYNRKIKPQVLFEQNFKCLCCGVDIDASCDIHHIVPVTKDPSLAFTRSNIQALCTNCHTLKHVDMGDSSTSPGTYKITSITPLEEEMTYDLQVAHKDANFVANGFVVHNCEKHRMLSSNSSSDRAIPISKMVDRPWFNPVDVRLNEKGMQGYKSASEADTTTFREQIASLHHTVCEFISSFPHIHKQHLNRYLLGFSFQSKIMTGTLDQWEYMLNLRDAPDADPAMQDLAKKIRRCIGDSEPTTLAAGEWHVPYYKEGYWKPHHIGLNGEKVDVYSVPLGVARKVSAARCARTSYDSFDGKRSVDADDIKLHNWLIANLHETPLEHQATPMKFTALDDEGIIGDFVRSSEAGITHLDTEGNKWSANMKGWVQYRKTL